MQIKLTLHVFTESSECKKFHMSSFNETTGLTHLKNNSVEFVELVIVLVYFKLYY